MIALALYQPEIPQNTGSMMRLCACLGAPVHIIEPCGFVWDDRKLKRAGMDYLALAEICRHRSWEAFCAAEAEARILLLTTKGACSYLDFTYRPGDILLVGQESAGVPAEVHAMADARLVIPMRPGARSLNVAMAAAMVMGEAARQIKGVQHGANAA